MPFGRCAPPVVLSVHGPQRGQHNLTDTSGEAERGAVQPSGARQTAEGSPQGEADAESIYGDGLLLPERPRLGCAHAPRSKA